jgi:hypothetical protein
MLTINHAERWVDLISSSSHSMLSFTLDQWRNFVEQACTLQSHGAVTPGFNGAGNEFNFDLGDGAKLGIRQTGGEFHWTLAHCSPRRPQHIVCMPGELNTLRMNLDTEYYASQGPS